MALTENKTSANFGHDFIDRLAIRFSASHEVTLTLNEVHMETTALLNVEENDLQAKAWRDPFFRSLAGDELLLEHPAGEYNHTINGSTQYWKLIVGETSEVGDDGGADDPQPPMTDGPPWCTPTDIVMCPLSAGCPPPVPPLTVFC